MHWGSLLRALLCPGLLCALPVGLILRGLAAWLGAHLGRRAAPPVWYPLAEFLHLARKAPRSEDGRPSLLTILPGFLALAALCWGIAMLPWPRGPFSPLEEPSGGLLLYLLLLSVPAWARLLLIGFSADPLVALGARRQVPLEVARLLPLTLAAISVPLYNREFGLVQGGDWVLDRALIAAVAAGLLLSTLPWPLWGRNEHDAPFAALGGRSLGVYRALESLELVAHAALIVTILLAGGLFPLDHQAAAWGVTAVATLAVLALFETGRRRPTSSEVVHRYTRWLLPAAALLVAAAIWLGG